MDTANPSSAAPALTLTPQAEAHLCKLATEKGQHVRLEIQAGGCSGFQRVFRLDTARDGDLRFGPNGAELLIDPISLDLVRGATIDYSDTLAGAEFVLKIPTATARCGCGASFSINAGA